MECHFENDTGRPSRDPGEQKQTKEQWEDVIVKIKGAYIAEHSRDNCKSIDLRKQNGNLTFVKPRQIAK